MRSALFALAVAIPRAPRAASSWTSRAADLPAADPDKLVPVADAGGDDVDEDLVSGRRRRLVDLEHLDGLAKCFDPGHSLAPRRHGGRSQFDASTAEVTAAPAG